MAEYHFDRDELKRRRLELGLRPERMAVELDVSKESYVAYETGKSMPPVARVLQLCQILDCSPEALLRPLPTITEVATRSGRRTRRAQGLPEHIEDPADLEEAAELLSR